MTGILDSAPMRRGQIIAIGLCIALNTLDGFDVMSIGFAAPGIAADWHVERAALGLVLSMELIGMAVGSIFVGRAADRFGRRPVVIFCLAVMTLGMFLATTAHDVVELSAFRLTTGLGIGGMLAVTNAIVAEFASAKRRNLCVALMGSGYPLGAVVGGSIASLLLVHETWRVVFMVGAVACGLLLPFIVWLLPETPDWLASARPPRALDRINAVLARIGQPPIAALPDVVPAAKSAVAALFAGPLARTTVLLTIGYFAHVMTFYFILKWAPKIVVDMGFPASSAGGVLVAANFGGMAGAITISLLTLKLPIKWLVAGGMLVSTVLVIGFGQVPHQLGVLSFVGGLAGFFTNGAIVGVYALLAAAYPAASRASGTGFVIGVGRGGAALGPIIAGQLFGSGASLGTVALVMATGSLVAAAAIGALRLGKAGNGGG